MCFDDYRILLTNLIAANSFQVDIVAKYSTRWKEVIERMGIEQKKGLYYWCKGTESQQFPRNSLQVSISLESLESCLLVSYNCNLTLEMRKEHLKLAMFLFSWASLHSKSIKDLSDNLNPANSKFFFQNLPMPLM